MDEINTELLESLLHRKIKIEWNHRVISGELIAVKGDIVVLRTIRQHAIKDIQIRIDEIDAIMFISKGRQTEP